MSHTLDQWLEKIQVKHPADIELGLERVSEIAKRLGVSSKNKHQKLIVIGGTNGKGTTAAILEQLSILHSKNVFCYSSPHILHFNERIRLNGQCIDDQSLIDSFEVIENIAGDVELTFFEFTTLAAMLIDDKFDADIAIYEIGLGGRLDAVNIMQPDISIITSIGLDHCDWLGENLVQIGAEKVAIARAGRPLIIGDDTISSEITSEASCYTKQIFKLGTDFFVEESNQRVNIRYNQSKIVLDLPQSVHPKNLATACFCASKIGFNFDQQQSIEWLKQAINQLFLPGRFETLNQQPKVIVDVSHNQQALAHLHQKISRLNGPIRLVCGMLSDKLQQQALKPFLGNGYKWYLATLNVARGARAEQLLQHLPNEQTLSYNDVESAVKSALKDSNGGGSLVIFGSFHTVEAATIIFNKK